MKITSKFSVFMLGFLWSLFSPQPLMAQEQANEDKTSQSPTLEIMETEIDLGTIAPETEEIVGTINIFNRGTAPLEVLKVDGPCACFSGWEGDTVVEPQKGGMLLAKFQKSEIQAGEVTRMVRVRTNDPVNDAVEVNFNFTVERGEMEEQVRLLREELVQLRKEVTLVSSDLKKVLDKMGIQGIQGSDTRKRKPVDTTVYDINIGSSPTLGPDDAPVTIVEFSDFECIFCIREFPTINQILKKYPDTVRVVYKHHPLKFHKKAKPAHAAAELAKREGGPEAFWKFHNMIMANPEKLEVADLRGYAESLNLNMSRFDEVLSDEKKMDDLLAADIAEAKKCKVTGTPTVFINGVELDDRSIQEYEARINQAVKRR